MHSLPLRRPGRWWVRWFAVAVALAMAAVGLSVTTPAHAEAVPIEDSFENGDWSTEGVQGKTSAIIGSFDGPRTGTELAILDAYPNAPAEARIYRTITLDDGAALPGICLPTLYVRSLTTGTHFDVQMWIKVRSGDRNGQILSVWGYDVNVVSWQNDPEPFGRFRWPRDSRSITIEIAAYRGVLAADDFALVC